MQTLLPEPHPAQRTMRPRLLVVMAHPDDESFGVGGTIAWYSWLGADVTLICTTGGEEGEVAPHFIEQYGSKQATRHAELRCAAEKLGLSQVYMLGYRDSGMAGTPSNKHPDALASAPLDEVTAHVTHLMRTLRPHVVVTFDPVGGYRHPDHIVSHQATVAAFARAGDASYRDSDLPPYQPQKLYYSVIPRGWLKWFVKVMPLFGRDPTRFGKNQDVDLTKLVADEFPIHARIAYHAVEDRRNAAVQCHASQIDSPTLTQSVVGWVIRALAGGESFMRAHPAPVAGHVERDLLADITVD